jgi:hypothetical protein
MSYLRRSRARTRADSVLAVALLVAGLASIAFDYVAFGIGLCVLGLIGIGAQAVGAYSAPDRTERNLRRFVVLVAFLGGIGFVALGVLYVTGLVQHRPFIGFGFLVAGLLALIGAWDERRRLRELSSTEGRDR